MSDSHTKAVAVIERGDDARVHPLVRMMRESGNAIDTTTIGEMMKLQREWEAGEAKRAYTAAIVALKRDMPTVIRKDKTVDFKNKEGRRTFYTHSSLAGAMDAVTESLTTHGFSLGWEPSTDKGQVTVTCRLTHSEGHSETCTISAPIDTSGNKSPAQGVASTITLLSRYTALSLLGIATADMAEPRGETVDPSVIDSATNLAMVPVIQKAGKSIAEAESHVGKKLALWTLGDVASIRAWMTPVEAEAAPDAEPQNQEPTQAELPKAKKAKGTVDERLADAGIALGYTPSQIANKVIDHEGNKDAALAELVAEFKAKHPK